MPRHGHSACAVGDKYIVVTAGRFDAGPKATAELFNVPANKWTDLPNMIIKRHYHSSCAFRGESVFVFCGIHNETRAYINDIEQLDLSMISSNLVNAWQKYQINSSPALKLFTAR